MSLENSTTAAVLPTLPPIPMMGNVTSLRYPQFQLSGRRDIPAILVPIAISSAFVAWKLYERRHPEVWEAPSFKETNKAEVIGDEKASAKVPDEEELASKREDIKKQVLEESEPEMTFMELGALVMFGLCWVITAIMSLLELFLRRGFFALLVGNMLATFVMAISLRPGNGVFHQHYAAGASAALMLLFSQLYSLPPWPLPVNIVTVGVALLAWWRPSHSSNWSMGIVFGFQSTALITFLVSTNISLNMQEDQAYAPASRLDSLILICPVVLWVLWRSIWDWSGLEPNTKPANARKVLFDIVCAALWFFNLVVMNVMLQYLPKVTAFATSCIGVQWLKCKDPIVPPSFSAPNMGSLPCLLLCSFYFFHRAHFNFWVYVRNSIDSIGWAVTAMLSVGLLLISVDTLGPGLPYLS